MMRKPGTWSLKQQLGGRIALASGLFGGGLAVESFLMIRRALWLQGLGPICGLHPSAAYLHCPGCYAAVLMMLAGVAVAAAPVRRTSPLRF